ncbi:hypothetical protein WS83_18825 [Burkholderia sp. MSMB2042]|nr:hypothetical protein WS78_09455 [Burkholderia savannae]KVG37896.1 hypothetical protein WS77_22155 [Burkholderia sp. MSMB0265]KVG78220.1 hypothetical protein WS81_16905 [Burkholderia sp. MSMB2040]KVG97510.1 hypothetical protein WS82_29230 [Burkholderia sp. MSMB2041]KVH01509.1 hypothetical protein WS83_18825 [Burkholderia sp. MSMB2042]
MLRFLSLRVQKFEANTSARLLQDARGEATPRLRLRRRRVGDAHALGPPARPPGDRRSADTDTDTDTGTTPALAPAPHATHRAPRAVRRRTAHAGR